MTDFQNKAKGHLTKMMDLYIQAEEGKISKEDAVRQINAISTESTLDALDHFREILDEVAAAYAAGNFELLMELVPHMHSMSVGVTASLMQQIQMKDEFGLDGLQGL